MKKQERQPLASGVACCRSLLKALIHSRKVAEMLRRLLRNVTIGYVYITTSRQYSLDIFTSHDDQLRLITRPRSYRMPSRRGFQRGCRTRNAQCWNSGVPAKVFAALCMSALRKVVGVPGMTAPMNELVGFMTVIVLHARLSLYGIDRRCRGVKGTACDHAGPSPGESHYAATGGTNRGLDLS